MADVPRVVVVVAMFLTGSDRGDQWPTVVVMVTIVEIIESGRSMAD